MAPFTALMLLKIKSPSATAKGSRIDVLAATASLAKHVPS